MCSRILQPAAHRKAMFLQNKIQNNMKKILLILLLLALTPPMSLVAETATISGSNTSDMEESVASICPVNLNYDCFVAQTLYPASVFANLYEVGETTFNINSLTIHCSINDNAYSNSGEEPADIKIYVENTTAASFSQDQSGKYNWLPVSDNAVVGQAAPVSNVDLFQYAYETYDFLFTFTDKKFEYTGENVLITWVSNTPIPFDSNSFEPFTGFETEYASSIYREADNDYGSVDEIFASGISKSNQKMLPVIDIDYDVVKIENGPTIVEGTPDVLKVGTYDADNEFGNDPGQTIPLNTEYKNCGSQLIYTSAELSGLPSYDDEGNRVTSKITALTFKLAAKTGVIYDTSCDIHGTVYIENSSLTSIPKTNGNPTWIDFSKENQTYFKIDLNDERWENVLWGDDEVIEYTINLENPIEYTGESLLITFDGGSDIAAAFLSHTIGFEVNDQSICFASDSKTFADAMSTEAPKPNDFLPVLKLHYTPLIEKVSEPKNIVSIEADQPMLMTATVDPALKDSKLTGISDFKQLTAANYVAIPYTIKDEQAGEGKSYEIMLDNKSLGTVDNVSGIIKFVNANPKSDLYLKVVPSDANSVGKATTIALDLIQSVMPQPEISVAKSKYYMTANESDPLKTDIHAAVKFLFGVPEQTVASVSFSSDSSNPQRRLLNDGSANENIVFDSEFLSLDADNWNQLHLNDRCVSFYYPNVGTGEYVDGSLEVPSRTFSSGLKAMVTYPTVYRETPVIDNTVMFMSDSYDIDESNVQNFTYKGLERNPLNEKYNGVQFTIEAPRAEDLSGVESVEVDANAPVEYFNLQGVRVAEPSAGMYIRRQGGKVSKVFVK